MIVVKFYTIIPYWPWSESQQAV